MDSNQSSKDLNPIDTANLHLSRAASIAALLECCCSAKALPHTGVLSVASGILRNNIKAAQKAIDALDQSPSKELGP